jgi:hypothetical protein
MHRRASAANTAAWLVHIVSPPNGGQSTMWRIEQTGGEAEKDP